MLLQLLPLWQTRSDPTSCCLHLRPRGSPSLWPRCSLSSPDTQGWIQRWYRHDLRSSAAWQLLRQPENDLPPKTQAPRRRKLEGGGCRALLGWEQAVSRRNGARLPSGSPVNLTPGWDPCSKVIHTFQLCRNSFIISLHIFGSLGLCHFDSFQNDTIPQPISIMTPFFGSHFHFNTSTDHLGFAGVKFRDLHHELLWGEYVKEQRTCAYS